MSSLQKPLERDQLIVTLPEKKELTLTEYIKKLKSQVNQLTNEDTESLLPEKLTPAPPKLCKIRSREPLSSINNSRPIRTSKEQADYELRLKKLKAKIAEREYKNMTKNITSKSATNNSLQQVLNQVGSASKIAYSQITIAFSVLISILAFFFIPIYALPDNENFPLGLRVGIGFVIASVVMAMEIYFYARAFMGESLGPEYVESKDFDLRKSFDKIYSGEYKNQEKIDRSKKKVDQWQKKNV